MENIIYSNLKYKETEGEPVTIINYRGYELGIWNDDNGQQFYTYIDDEEIGFGAFNTNFRDDLEYLVDNKLDTIYSFDHPYWGARLEWFDNAGYRDIKLVYRMRVLKIWVISDSNKISGKLVEQIREESQQILDKYISVEKK